MEVKDLKARMGNIDIILTITEKLPIREFDKFGKKGRVCNATAQDTTGQISLTLWNDDVDKVNAGDKIQLKNGWVGEYQGSLQLSTGKFGELSVLEHGAVPEAAAETPKQPQSTVSTKQVSKSAEDEDADEGAEPFKDGEAVENIDEEEFF